MSNIYYKLYMTINVQETITQKRTPAAGRKLQGGN